MQTVSQDLRAAYARTRFIIDLRDRQVVLIVGMRSTESDELLTTNGADQAAFLTAYNPGSRVLPQAENEARQKQIIGELERSGYKLISGRGESPDGSWPPEESVLVLGITTSKAVKVAEKFGQFAVVFIRCGEPAELMWTSATESPQEQLLGS